MGMNIFDLKPVRPILGDSVRKNADGNAAATSKFDWNNLISTLGDSISSIFSGLSGMKQAEAYQNQQVYNQRKNNSVLWIGIAVVAVIVIAVVMVSRKK